MGMTDHKCTRREATARPQRFAFAVLGILAFTAACSPIPGSAEAGIGLKQKNARWYGGACFYSDAFRPSGIAGDRSAHWCGPEPKAVF
jgi:hypothetical protein